LDFTPFHYVYRKHPSLVADNAERMVVEWHNGVVIVSIPIPRVPKPQVNPDVQLDQNGDPINGMTREEFEEMQEEYKKQQRRAGANKRKDEL
jgi:hypothetical protein